MTSLDEKIVDGIVGGLVVASLLGLRRAVVNWWRAIDQEILSKLLTPSRDGEHLFQSGRGYSREHFSRWESESAAWLEDVRRTIEAGISRKEAIRFLERPQLRLGGNYYGGEQGGGGSEHNSRLNSLRGYIDKITDYPVAIFGTSILAPGGKRAELSERRFAQQPSDA